MRKYISILLFGGVFINAQVGINTTTPNSTLAVNGSLRAGYSEVTTPAYTISGNGSLHYLQWSS
ncbi:hypothetical protein LF887_15845 [Chryseobacterium sp. MEBOG06]|uniref:hypothetical protein n=1 Tax=Chryseobacterium sp. MEBOG06 TaxID=2879938 RepID=UPI001F36CA23|nr:hypothetical protein [Chryseobacterium sp. MEBOG06]UKB82475.1 hypothetical protein LF887_15845 [Chryseobacterium sp. MEBOG06]